MRRWRLPCRKLPSLRKEGVVIVRVFALVAALVSVSLSQGFVGLARAEDVIKIGAPLAATGAEAREGVLAKQGYDLWAETVNARGGIKVADKTYKVQIVYYD